MPARNKGSQEPARAAAPPRIREHAAGQARELLDRFSAQVDKTRGALDPDGVHDLRVSIRRLRQCLQVFGQFFPARRRVRRRLKKLMDRAGEVRNLDIAMDLLACFGVPPGAAVLGRLASDRARAAAKLSPPLERHRVRGLAGKWRRRLEL